MKHFKLPLARLRKTKISERIVSPIEGKISKYIEHTSPRSLNGRTTSSLPSKESAKLSLLLFSWWCSD